MGVTSAWDLALITRLKAHAPLVAAATGGIYAGVAPQDTTPPFVVLDDTDFVDSSDASHTGFEVFTRILTMSRSPGRKQTRDIQDLIYDALHRQEAQMTVADHSILFVDRDGSTVDDPTDKDGSFRGVCEYRALITKNAADY